MLPIVWFGVLLAVNMQTSFMHPPFGFALFYLRSVAARTDYKDRITGATIPAPTPGAGAADAVATASVNGASAAATTSAASPIVMLSFARAGMALIRAGKVRGTPRACEGERATPLSIGARDPPGTMGPGMETIIRRRAARHARNSPTNGPQFPPCGRRPLPTMQLQEVAPARPWSA